MKLFLSILLATAAIAQDKPAKAEPVKIAAPDLNELRAKFIEAYEANERINAIRAQMNAEIQQLKERYEKAIGDADLERAIKTRAVNDRIRAMRETAKLPEKCSPDLKEEQWKCPETDNEKPAK